jgi:Tol biopolymer transport system component
MFSHRLAILLSLASAGFFVPHPVHAQAVGQKICEINADGTGLRDIYVVPANVSVGSPVISSDGKMLAFEVRMLNSSRGLFTESGQRQSVIMTIPTSSLPVTEKDTLGLRVDGGGQPRTHPNLGYGAMPGWSPGGHRLVYSMPGQGAAFVMRADGTDLIQMHPQGWAAKWSPDGRMIAFLNKRNGNQLRVYDMIEDEEFAIGTSSFQSIYAGFDWSPDSSSIAFSAKTRTGKYLIARAGVLNRGEYEELRPGANARRISWHPDGSRLLYSVTQRLVTIPARGAESQAEVIPGIPDDLSAEVATWSPDGKKIIFIGTLNR